MFILLFYGKRVQALDKYLTVGAGSPIPTDCYITKRLQSYGTLHLRIIWTKCPPAQVHWTGAKARAETGTSLDHFPPLLHLWLQKSPTQAVPGS